MSHLSDLMSCNTSALILSEDIRGTWCLWCWASGAFTLSQLFESSNVKYWLTGLICFGRCDLFIEAISDSLSESVDASLATMLWLLVPYSLIVTVGVKGSCTRVQFHTTTLSWHLSCRLCWAFAYVLIASLWNRVVLMSSRPGMRSLLQYLACDTLVLGCQDRILSSAAYSW